MNEWENDVTLAKSLIRDWLRERGVALTGVNGEVLMLICSPLQIGSRVAYRPLARYRPRTPCLDNY